jgi:beta-phosphoglucomutase-like phosphatase (HAD superfamily)
MQIKAVAWDLDGTLVDSEALHLEAMNTVSAEFGADITDIPEGTFRGVHMHDVWASLAPRLPGVAFDDWIREIIAYYVRNAAKIAETRGARATVATIAELGLAQACVSNSNRVLVDANIAVLGIADRIQFSISLDDVTEGKPNPEPYRQAAARFGLRPDEVAAVEDSATGARSARSAGLLVIGYKMSRPGGEDVDVIIDELDELPGLIGGADTPRL